MAGSETAATQELRALNPSLERRFVRLTDRVFVAAGYGGSTFSFVVGDTGIVAVDAGSAPGPAAKAIAELRRYSDLPIVGLVYTHGHIDHTYGAMAFVEENPDIEIWAIKPFGTEARTLARNGAEIAATRALRHFGVMLPPDKTINTGVAPRAAPEDIPTSIDPDPRTRPTRRFEQSVTFRCCASTTAPSPGPCARSSTVCSAGSTATRRP